jgi:hypothetical protein
MVESTKLSSAVTQVMLAGLSNTGSAPITAFARIRYNFSARTFHGNFTVNAQLEVARATGSLVLYFSPREWYIKIGDPEGERVRIRVLDFINLQAYLMVGMNLPSMPPLPPEVTELTGPIPAPVRPAELGRGDGFAFGARADFAPPELRFLIFYASIRFLVGFDVALLNYGATAQCADGRPMGANGWYATGQMYARLDASVGLYVDLWFIQGKFEILGLSVGALLQAGASEPHMDRWGGGWLLLDFGRADLRLLQLPVYTRRALHSTVSVCAGRR